MNEKFPNFYLFNPTCEYAVANSNSSWQPNKLLQKMEADLATLPLFFTKPNDFVIVNNIPSKEFLKSLETIDISIPNFILIKEIKTNKEIIDLPKFKLLPWGWSPVAHRLLSPLKQNCSDEFLKSPVSNWQPGYRDLYSKKTALKILSKILLDFPNKYFIDEHKKAKICTTKKEIEILLKQWGELMVKAPWSSSGRGLQTVLKSNIHPKVWEKLLGIIKEQGYIIVEPFLNKKFDLAILFEQKKGNILYKGISNFITNSKGQYLGNYLNGLPNNLDKKVADFVKSIPEIIIQPLINSIENSQLAKLYEGYFGVDTLIFLDDRNELKINPCLEINLRQNMGILSLYLEKYISPNKKGTFLIFHKPGVSFLTFKTEMEFKYPLQQNGYKIESGFLALTEANQNSVFGAYILV